VSVFTMPFGGAGDVSLADDASMGTMSVNRSVATAGADAVHFSMAWQSAMPQESHETGACNASDCVGPLTCAHAGTSRGPRWEQTAGAANAAS